MKIAVGFLVALVSLLPPRAAQAGESYAFLVSVKEYDEKELRPLQFTRNDMLDLRRTLLDSGFPPANIVLMHDDVPRLENRKFLPEGAKIREQLRLLLGGVEPGDTVVVALAGHGVQFRGDDQSYFCPIDAKLADRDTLISFRDLYAALKECRGARKLLLVDACRNDPQSVLSRSRSTVDLESVTRPQRQDVPEGIVALFSCSPGQQSYEHPALRHGIFFHHVLQAWKGDADFDRDSRVTFDELAGFVKRETAAYARRQLDVLQTPHLQSDAAGDWVLRVLQPATKPGATPPAAAVTGQPQPAAARPGNSFISRDKAGSPSSVQGQLAAAEAELKAAERARDEAHEAYNRNEIGKTELQIPEIRAIQAKERYQRLLDQAAKRSGDVAAPTEVAAPSPGIKRTVRPPELKKLDAELKSAEADHEKAAKTLERRREVYAVGRTTAKDVLDAIEQEARAREKATALRLQVHELEAKLGLK